MSLLDTATGYHYFSAFSRNFRRDANGDIQVQVFDRSNRGLGSLGELGSWWQDLIAAGVGAGASIYATQQQGQPGQQQQAQQVVAAFFQLYNFTFPALQQIIQAFEAGQVPANQVVQVVAAADQIWAQWQSATGQMSAAVSATTEVATGVSLRTFIQECNAALTVKMNRIRALAQQQPAAQQQATLTPTVNAQGQVIYQQASTGGITDFFNQSIFGIPAWAVAAAVILFVKSRK